MLRGLWRLQSLLYTSAPATPEGRQVDFEKRYDVIVIGGGHAGTEAALAAARLGADTSYCLRKASKPLARCPATRPSAALEKPTWFEKSTPWGRNGSGRGSGRHSISHIERAERSCGPPGPRQIARYTERLSGSLLKNQPGLSSSSKTWWIWCWRGTGLRGRDAVRTFSGRPPSCSPRVPSLGGKFTSEKRSTKGVGRGTPLQTRWPSAFAPFLSAREG